MCQHWQCVISENLVYIGFYLTYLYQGDPAFLILNVQKKEIQQSSYCWLKSPPFPSFFGPPTGELNTNHDSLKKSTVSVQTQDFFRKGVSVPGSNLLFRQIQQKYPKWEKYDTDILYPVPFTYLAIEFSLNYTKLAKDQFLDIAEIL